MNLIFNGYIESGVLIQDSVYEENDLPSVSKNNETGVGKYTGLNGENIGGSKLEQGSV